MGGLVNKAIFPKPKVSYEKSDFEGIDRLFWVPSSSYKESILIFEFFKKMI